jgi:Cys-tRNA(Pro)/Cys-tRNA(Cys) deacylase
MSADPCAAIAARLAAAGVPHRIHAHAAAVTAAEARERLPFPAELALKTLAFRCGGGWILAALRAADRVDYARLAAGLGVRRADLAAADPTVDLGFLPGGVGPVAPAAGPRVAVDAAAMALPLAYCGAGRPDRTLEIAPEDLVRAADAVVFAFAR